MGRLLPSSGGSRWRGLGNQFRYTTQEMVFRLSSLDGQTWTPVYRAFTAIPHSPQPNPGLLSLVDPKAGVDQAFRNTNSTR